MNMEWKAFWMGRLERDNIYIDQIIRSNELFCIYRAVIAQEEAKG